MGSVFSKKKKNRISPASKPEPVASQSQGSLPPLMPTPTSPSSSQLDQASVPPQSAQAGPLVAEIDNWKEIIAHDRVDLLEAIIVKGFDINHVSPTGKTPLFFAARQGARQCFAALISKNAVVSSADPDGSTIFHELAKRGDVDSLDLISVPLLNSLNGDQQTPAMVAVYHGHSDFVKKSKDLGFESKGADALGRSLLDLAAMGPNENLALELIEHANPVHQDFSGNTTLHHALARGHAQLAKALLEKGYDPAVLNSQGETALYLAAQLKDHAKSILIFNELSKKFIDMRTHRGRTLAHAAAEVGNAEILAQLSVRKASLDEPDQEGLTPLLLAALNGQASAMSFLIKNGAKLDSRGHHQESIIYLALQSKSVPTVEYLLSQLKDLNLAALMQAACKNRDLPMVKMFFKRDKSLAKIDKPLPYFDSQTPLLLAVECGDLAFTKELVAAGADVNQTNLVDYSPWLIAKKLGHQEMVHFLKSEGAQEISFPHEEFPDFRGVPLAKPEQQERGRFKRAKVRQGEPFQLKPELLSVGDDLNSLIFDAVKKRDVSALQKALNKLGGSSPESDSKEASESDEVKQEKSTEIAQPLMLALRTYQFDLAKLLLDKIRSEDLPLLLRVFLTMKIDLSLFKELLLQEVQVPDDHNPRQKTVTRLQCLFEGIPSYFCTQNQEAYAELINFSEWCLSQGAKITHDFILPLVQTFSRRKASSQERSYLNWVLLHRGSLVLDDRYFREVRISPLILKLLLEQGLDPFLKSPVEGKDADNSDDGHDDFSFDDILRNLLSLNQQTLKRFIGPIIQRAIKEDVLKELSEGTVRLYFLKVHALDLSKWLERKFIKKYSWSEERVEQKSLPQKICEGLIAKNLDPEKIDWNHIDSLMTKPLVEEHPLFKAIKQKDEDASIHVFEEVPAEKNKDGLTPLLYAASLGRLKWVELFLKKGVSIEEADQFGWTALCYACALQHESLVKFLIKQGASLNPTLPDSFSDDVGAELIAEKGDEIIVHKPRCFFESPLMLAARGLFVEVQPISSKNDPKLELVPSKKSLLAILVQSGADIAFKNQEGKTALFVAIESKNIEAIKILAESGSDLKSKQQIVLYKEKYVGKERYRHEHYLVGESLVKELSPIQYAARINFFEAVSFLCSKNGYSSEDLSSPDEEGRSILDYAIFHDQETLAREWFGKGCRPVFYDDRWLRDIAVSRPSLEDLRSFELLISMIGFDHLISKKILEFVVSFLKGSDFKEAYLSFIKHPKRYFLLATKASQFGLLKEMALFLPLTFISEMLSKVTLPKGFRMDFVDSSGNHLLHVFLQKVANKNVDIEEVRENLTKYDYLLPIKNNQSVSPLAQICSARRECLDVVRIIIDLYPKLDALALLQALKAGHKKIADFLLDFFIQKNPQLLQDSSLQSVLVIAAQRGLFGLIPKLLEAGASLEGVDEAGNNVLHRLIQKDRKDEFNQVIATCVSKNLSVINHQNEESFSPLHIAAACSDSLYFNTLIKVGANIALLTKAGESTLSCALRSRTQDTIDYLVDAFSKPEHRNLLSCQNPEGDTPLHQVLQPYSPNEKLVRKLLDLDVNLKLINSKRQSLLHLVSSLKDIVLIRAFIQKLIKENSSLLNCKDAKGQTPLAEALNNKRFDVAEILLEYKPHLDFSSRDGENVVDYISGITGDRSPTLEFNRLLFQMIKKDSLSLFSQPGKNGLLPLWRAACNNNFAAVKALLEVSPDSLIQIDPKVGTILHLCRSPSSWDRASHGCHEDIFNFLFDKIVEQKTPLLMVQDDLGDTILHKDCPFTALTRTLQLFPDILEIKNKKGRAPLGSAVARNSLSMVKFFIDAAGIDFNADNYLSLALSTYDKDMILFILAKAKEQAVNLSSFLFQAIGQYHSWYYSGGGDGSWNNITPWPEREAVLKAMYSAFLTQLDEGFIPDGIDEDGNTVVHALCQDIYYGDEYKLNIFHKDDHSLLKRVLELLPKNIVNLKDKKGMSALALACNNGFKDRALLLIESGVQIDDDILENASLSLGVDFFKALIQLGAKITDAAIFRAIEAYDTPVCLMLIDSIKNESRNMSSLLDKVRTFYKEAPYIGASKPEWNGRADVVAALESCMTIAPLSNNSQTFFAVQSRADVLKLLRASVGNLEVGKLNAS